MEHRSRSSLLVVLLACGAATACTESDEVFRDIGTTLVYFTNPGLQPQGLSDGNIRIQSVEWEIEEALFELSGTEFDLVFGEACSSADSVALALPVAEGKCAGGGVIDASEAAVTVRLSVTFTMRARRAVPPFEFPSPEGDYDGDGAPDAVDNCPIEFNDDQQDLDGNGIGETCEVIDPFSGIPLRDSDLDRVADDFDNCVWLPNPSQTDTSSDLPDGVGDACAEQVLDVTTPAGDNVIRFEDSVDLVQPLGAASFLILDFGDLTCDWVGSSCTLDPATLGLCASNNVLTASLGCP